MPEREVRRTDDYVTRSEEALEREPLPRDDETITPKDRALVAALEAIAQAILALARKK